MRIVVLALLLLTQNAWSADAFMGMHFHYISRLSKTGTYSPLPDQGTVQSWRIWDAGARWGDLEPQQGVWKFDGLDRAVEAARRDKLDILYVLGSPPAWAAANPLQDGPYGPGSSSMPASIADWERYVTAVATRYKGLITSYELWNEPLFSDYRPYRRDAFFSGSSRDMVSLEQAARRALDTVDRSLKLLTPGFTGPADQLDLYFKSGGGKYADAIAFHFYSASTSEMTRAVEKVRATMMSNGFSDKELWNTEQGYTLLPPNSTEPGPDGIGVASAGLLAARTAQTIIIQKSLGIGRVYWYSWEILGASIAPALSVSTLFSQLTSWLNFGDISACQDITSIGIYACKLRGREASGYIVWSQTATAKLIAFPNEWSIRCVQRLDRSPCRSWRRGELATVTSMPLLLLQ